jgi:PST family polysaccharide transporter
VSSTAGLGRSLKRGVIWSAADTVILRLGQFAIGIVIARLISPREFGVFVVANTVYLIITNVSEIGVSTALVREIDNARNIAPTVSTIAIANSAILAAGMYLAAPALASALGAPAATEAVRVLTIPLLLAGPTAVPAALLMRDFRQGRKLIADLVNFIVANGILLILALNGGGVMALAWSRAAGQAASCILLLALVSERYWPGFDIREARRLLRFGAPLAGASLAGFTLGNVDFITVGRVAGPLQLGYYNLAFNVSSWPVSVFTTILSSVTLPALARVKGGVRQLERHVAAALSALCAAAFPVTALTLVLAYPVVVVMYGARWAPAAQILEILAVFGAIRVIIQLFSDVLVAIGKSKLLFQLQLVWLASLVPAVIVLVHLKGGTGAAIAHVAVAGGIVLPVYLVIMVRSVGIPIRIIIRPVIHPLLSASVAGAVAWLAEAQVSSTLGRLCVGIGCFSLIYLVLLGRWTLRLRTELTSLYGHADDSVAGPVREFAQLPSTGRHRKVTGIKVPVGHPVGLGGFADDYGTGVDILAGFTLDFSTENHNGKSPKRSRGGGRHRGDASADSPGEGHR